MAKLIQVKKLRIFEVKHRIALNRNGILLAKLFWPTAWKNCYSDREKNLEFEAEGQEFAKKWDH